MPTIKARKNSSSPWETVKALPQTGTVRYDQTQSLSDDQKALARQNIGADGAVSYLTNQVLTEQEKANARNNIGVTDSTITHTSVSDSFIIDNSYGATGTVFTAQSAGYYIIGFHALMTANDGYLMELMVDSEVIASQDTQAGNFANVCAFRRLEAGNKVKFLVRRGSTETRYGTYVVAYCKL